VVEVVLRVVWVVGSLLVAIAVVEEMEEVTGIEETKWPEIITVVDEEVVEEAEIWAAETIGKEVSSK
jgi:hypothetical protein